MHSFHKPTEHSTPTYAHLGSGQVRSGQVEDRVGSGQDPADQRRADPCCPSHQGQCLLIRKPAQAQAQALRTPRRETQGPTVRVSVSAFYRLLSCASVSLIRIRGGRRWATAYAASTRRSTWQAIPAPSSARMHPNIQTPKHPNKHASRAGRRGPGNRGTQDAAPSQTRALSGAGVSDRAGAEWGRCTAWETGGAPSYCDEHGMDKPAKSGEHSPVCSLHAASTGMGRCDAHPFHAGRASETVSSPCVARSASQSRLGENWRRAMQRARHARARSADAQLTLRYDAPLLCALRTPPSSPSAASASVWPDSAAVAPRRVAERRQRTTASRADQL